MPSSISEKQYWIQLRSDASRAWVEGGLGISPIQTRNKIFIPGLVAASGVYVSGYGLAELECHLQGTTVYLSLSQESSA